jgi:hypothetical protein
MLVSCSAAADLFRRQAPEQEAEGVEGGGGGLRLFGADGADGQGADGFAFAGAGDAVAVEGFDEFDGPVGTLFVAGGDGGVGETVELPQEVESFGVVAAAPDGADFGGEPAEAPGDAAGARAQYGASRTRRTATATADHIRRRICAMSCSMVPSPLFSFSCKIKGLFGKALTWPLSRPDKSSRGPSRR